MFLINKITSDTTVDFAAEELKKYLRMMMPECGDIKIFYKPDAEGGFRLGLMQDFGLDVTEVDDVELDDIIYVDTDARGGVIAGDNPRSVLMAVYEYLRQNGCNWYFPGVDGEYIPMQEIKPVKYKHIPSCRYRGWCNEGAESQTAMLETIDLCPKLGMNTYMLEFRIPRHYYSSYYEHYYNEDNRAPEPISDTQVLQWKRMCETEISKRGLQFHDIGHGFTVDPFGVDSANCWTAINDDDLSPDTRKFLAEINGHRGLFRGQPVNTQFCMSNPEARRIFCDYVVDYAARHSNETYLHVWLADAHNNHCECEECRKKTTSDWYMILMNELDTALAKAGLKTRIVFIVYLDTTWAPEVEKIENPERFTLLLAPITRSYDATLPPLKEGFKKLPYVRNKLTMPDTLTENLEYLKDWESSYKGLKIAFEYHFWRHNILEPSGIGLARRIVEDVKTYKKNNIDGMIEDGTVRCFFPNGYAYYAAARSMFDTRLEEKDIAKDYFPYLYGEDWEKIYSVLEELSALFDTSFMEGRLSKKDDFSLYYNPEHAKDIEKIPETVKALRELIEKNYNSDYRVRTVAIRLLEHFADYCEGLSGPLYEKALGNEEKAKELFEKFLDDFGKREVMIESYYDHFMVAGALSPMIKPGNNSKKPIII